MEAQYRVEVPDLVMRAKALAEELGFDLRPQGNPAGGRSRGPSACTDEVGALLRTFAASVQGGRIGEVGTGAGVGAAWLASGMRSGSSLYTVEIDSVLANGASSLFEDRDEVFVLTGDWREALPGIGEFDLLFFDGGGREALQPDNWSLVSDLVVPGGLMVLDDLTPVELWPESWRGQPDLKRELAFKSGLFTSSELRTTPKSSVLVMSRN